ncbi:hypothetical protein R1sor_002454 [Riccia sorocarpa]|uniref:Uncharacterized protein n=1 Tax=Riccia sorocarpa TaxID=122646 RepID=A0ABD3H1H1_9MARC
MAYSRVEVGLLCFLLVLLTAASESDSTPDQLYLVKMRSHPGQTEEEALLAQRAVLSATVGGDWKLNNCMIYSFTKVLNGFAAKLTSLEADKLSGMDGVLTIIPNTILNITTTNSWKFLGVESLTAPNTGALWKKAKYGDDVIIGMVDTGIWPESASFSDAGLGPVPSRWKGTCVEGQQFTKANCNRKIIGARYYSAGISISQNEYQSARDLNGHGTHTSSTAGGAFASASLNGYATGTAKGGAPRARIAVYKVCWLKPNGRMGCSTVDMVAAMEDAITDGVDLMSISISGSTDAPFYFDAVGISSFHAMKRGILVNFAAGNEGPTIKTTNHNEPWSLTVAATSQDRFLGADVVISQTIGSQPGLKLKFRGATLTNYPTLTAPLVLASEASINPDDSKSLIAATFCSDSSMLDSSKITGKIVFCLLASALDSPLDKSENVRLAGGAGVIIGNSKGVTNYTLRPFNHNIPAVHLEDVDAERLVNYVKECDLSICVFRDGNVQATIFPGQTFLKYKPAPVVALFSSNGPSGVTSDILKPDIAAPGLDILAAYTNGRYVLDSGTSMATPHIAGIAALLKVIHPKWSPAAIKSAIMTSAHPLDNEKHRITNYLNRPASPFATGSGLVNPVAAADPGLIYEAGPHDYSLFLCSLYSDKEVEMITGESFFCSSQKHIPPATDLNYPSVSVGKLVKSTTVTRKVTNVGKATSVYKVKVEAPKGVKVTITPSTLSFDKYHKTKTFKIHLKRTHSVDLASPEGYVFGSYTWSDGKHRVRSPIVVGHAPQ